MIALPVPAHATTTGRKDSAAVVVGAQPGMSASQEEWPSLGGGGGSPQAPVGTGGGGEGDDWEMLSNNDAGGGEGTGTTNGEAAKEAVLVQMPPPCRLTRKNSVSAPDLRELDDDQDLSILNLEDAPSESVVMVSGPPSVASSSFVKVPSNNPWGGKNKVSFRDAILSPSKHAAPGGGATKAATTVPATAAPRIKNKVKPRYVVTPIKRCAKSTGDLLALAEQEEEDEDDGPMGAEDAMEYYNRKAHGAHGRSNGLKIRPDEAKRKQMIVQKKNAQRQKGRS